MLILLLVTGVRAQDPPSTADPADRPRFETEIVVTPERGETPRNIVAGATVVLDAAALAMRPVTYPSEMISLLPGFTVARPRFDAGRPVVSARGFFGGGEAEYLVLLVDGVPWADAESGLIDWGAIAASSVRRIEAVRGPGASLYGDSAVGGVVQLLTDRAARSGRLTAAGGSFSTLTGDGFWGGQMRGANYSLSGAARGTGGAYEHSSARHYTGAGALEGRFGAWSWRSAANGGWRRRDDPGSLNREAFRRNPSASDALYRFDGVERRDGSATVALRHESPAWLPQARIAAVFRDEDLIRTILLAPGLGDRRARALATTAVRGSAEGQHDFGAERTVTLRFGTDVSREGLETTYRGVSASGAVQAVNSHVQGHRLRTGVFASSGWEAASRVRLSGGLRWDGVDDGSFPRSSSRVNRAWSPRAGVTVSLNGARTLTAFGQIARGFKAPTPDQLFDPRPYPDFRGGTFTISNPRLVPQRATNVEAGISGTGVARWSLTVYRADVANEIDFDVRTFSYANIGESLHTGVEIEGETTWWRLTPSVAYALSRVTTDASPQLKNVPRHRTSVATGVALPLAIHGYVRVDRTAGAFLDDEHALGIDAPTTVDLRVRRALGRHAVFVDVLNLTDDRYEEYGFTLTDFAGRVVPYVYPGAGRAARLGATVAF